MAETQYAADVRRCAERYCSQHWFVYLQGRNSKAPIAGTRGYLDATDDFSVIAERLAAEPEANLAHTPGRAGLIVIEADGGAALDAAHQLGIKPGLTLECTRGAPDRTHYYFKKPLAGLPLIGNLRLVEKTLGLEVRCDRGGITLPPSRHPSGATYRWAGNLSSIAALPPLALAAVREGVERFEQSEAERLALPAIDPSSLTTEDLDRRVRAYVAKLGNVGAGLRDSSAFQFAAWLVRDMALGADAALAYLVEWNAGNQPPLSHRDLTIKIQSAQRHGRRAVGAGLVERRLTHSPLPPARAPRVLPTGPAPRVIGGR